MAGLLIRMSLRRTLRSSPHRTLTELALPQSVLLLRGTKRRFFVGRNASLRVEGSNLLFSSRNDPSWSPFAAACTNNDDDEHDDVDDDYHYLPSHSSQYHRNTQNPFFQQVRWKRRDGHKASTAVRKPTKKQYKEYNRKVRARQHENNRHGSPGSKAGGRREWMEQTKQDLLASRHNDTLPAEQDGYDMDDALLDDLIGNTQFLSSQPTPKPVYLGHKEKHYFHRVADQMERYQLQMKNTTTSTSSTDDSADTLNGVANTPAELPSDRDISLALRSYRDRQGTRQKPVGIVAALKFVLQDLGVPLAALDENTYTTMLTCCRTPAEGRRILQMMDKQQQPVTTYSWSILIDIHAKIGDFEGCVQVMDEMVAKDVAPGLPAYTSLMAACYKVCNDGRIARSIRNKAGEVGWRKWQEMRIVGLEPDVMAFGAMLRLCAAKGEPEKALGLLEEMEQFKVKPTTLCFSSALRAVARSHATAIRYEQGASKKNRRREFLTNHHGKMARTLVIMAENAEVHQDRSFVSALIGCAAAAGDVATAKAIYVASQVRRLDQLRTIGPNSHLAGLRGQTSTRVDAATGAIDMGLQQRSTIASGDGAESSDLALAQNALADPNASARQRKRYPSFGQREYGKDTRPLSAILHACAQSVDKSGIGTMWQGRENRGYLDEDSLRLLTARRMPNYHDNSIPGMDSRQVAASAMTWDGEDRELGFRGDKRKQNAWDSIDDDEHAGTTLDDIDEMFARMYVDDDGRLKKEFRKTTPEDIWRAKYPEDNEQQGDLALPDRETTGLLADTHEGSLQSVPNEPKEEMYFDTQLMKWQTRKKEKEQITPEVVSSSLNSSPFSGESASEEEMFFDNTSMRWSTRKRPLETKSTFNTDRSTANELEGDLSATDSDKEMYFDSNEMQWKNRSRMEAVKAKSTDYEAKMLSSENEKGRVNENASGGEETDEIDEEEFAKFFNELKDEIASSGEGLDDFDVDEARELFLAMKDEYKEVMAMDMDDIDLTSLGGRVDLESFKDFGLDDTSNSTSLSNSLDDNAESSLPLDEELEPDEDENFDTFFDEQKDEWREQGVELGDIEANEGTQESLSASTGQPSYATERTTTGQTIQAMDNETWSEGERFKGLAQKEGATFTETIEVLDDAEVDMRERQLDYLREALPAFPDNRLVKIQKTFNKSLGDPSLLELTSIVRERMPDYITSTWLKQMGSLTARYVMHAASQDGLVDVHMLNGVLELDTSSGSLDRALEFHQTQFTSQGLTPNGYSDRLVLQMFVKNNRLQRALAFKLSVEEAGRTLDLQSYGSLIDFCGRHNQLGSGLLLLKECLSVHKAAPGEACLSQIRVLCRQADLMEKVGLTDLIGQDPAEWLRHGEANLKREYSKKGRRDVQISRNALLQL